LNIINKLHCFDFIQNQVNCFFFVVSGNKYRKLLQSDGLLKGAQRYVIHVGKRIYSCIGIL
jgi:hypothetical protein